MSIYDDEKRTKASPATRKLAKDLGVDLNKVMGTGLDGRIQVEDIKRYVNNGSEDENDMGMDEYKASEINDVKVVGEDGIDFEREKDSFADSIIDKSIEESLENVIKRTMEESEVHSEEKETLSEVISENSDITEEKEEDKEVEKEEIKEESETIIDKKEEEIKKELAQAIDEDILDVLGLQVDDIIDEDEEETEDEEEEEFGGYILGMPLKDPDEISVANVAYEEAIKESYSIKPIESTKNKDDESDEDSADEAHEVDIEVQEEKEELNDIAVTQAFEDVGDESISDYEIERILNDPDYKPEEKAQVPSIKEDAPIVTINDESETTIRNIDNDMIMFENANNSINLDEDEDPEIEIEINHITNDGIISTSKDINYENADKEIKDFIETNSKAIFGSEVDADSESIIVNHSDIETVESEASTKEERVDLENNFVLEEDKEIQEIEDKDDDIIQNAIQTSITGEDVSLDEIERQENNDVLEVHSPKIDDDGYYQEGVVITLNDEVINTIIVDEDILGKIDDDNKLVLSTHTHNSLAMGINVDSSAIKERLKPLEPTKRNMFYATIKAIACSLKKHDIPSFDDSFFIYQYRDTFTRKIIENVSKSTVNEIKENSYIAQDELESVYKIIDVNSFDIDYFFPKQCKEKVEIIVFVNEDTIKVIINSDKNLIDFPEMANVLMTLKKDLLNPANIEL